MEKYREGQELHCVFVDLEKAYDNVPREEVWYCMRKSGLAEKYVRIVPDIIIIIIKLYYRLAVTHMRRQI